MNKGERKSHSAIAVGQCENCGTRHAHAGTGCICYLCGGFLRLVERAKAAAHGLLPRAQPASVALINELYARTEAE